MWDGARAESFTRERAADAVEVSTYAPKISQMTDIFIPRAEIFPTRRSKKPIEAWVPGIRIETRPEGPQKRAHNRAKREKQRREAVEAQTVLYRKQNQMYDDFITREQQQIKDFLVAAGSVLAVLGVTGAIGVAVLEGQALLASTIASLEGLTVLALSAGFEALRGLLTILATGDPTFIALTALVGFSLLTAFHKAVESAVEARTHRKEYSY